MEKWTLREICNRTRVSRRAIQGYEKAGLVSAIEKNYRGYLMYGKQEEERIQLIRLLQQIGFSISEISKIIDGPKQMLGDAIEKQIIKLQGKKDEIEILINRAYKLIEEL